MALFNADVTDFYAAAADLAKVGARAIPAVRSAMAQAGDVFAETWAENARATAGAHGKHYPDSIESDLAFAVSSVAVDVGPNPAKKQGGMSFEFGSRNQPPHLDGLRAMEEVAPLVEQLLDQVIAGTFVAAAPKSGSGLQSYTTKAGVTRMATPAQIANWTRGSR